MAVIVSNGSGNLNAANQFYKSAARNPAPVNGTGLNATTERLITFTPDDTGHALGAVICLYAGATINRGFSVELQQNIATVWTTVDSKVLTCTEITNYASSIRGEWIIPFTFTAGTVSLTAAASTWRLRLIQSGGTTGTWYVETSDGTNAFYILWTDTAHTFSSGDTPCAKYPDVITLNITTTLGPSFGTGAATRGIAAIATRSTSYTTAHETFNWTTSASITVSCDGHFIYSTHGGVKFGTSTVPITYANKGTLYFITPTGGGTYGGFRCCAHGTSSVAGYIEIYGQVPTHCYTTLASDANTLQAHIITTDDTSAGAVNPWTIGDTVYVGKVDASGISDVAARTISNISTTDITLSSNLTQKRLAGATVIRTNGYGFVLQGANANTIQQIQQINSVILSGVQIHQTWFNGYTALGTGTQETSSTIKQSMFQDCSYIPQGTASTVNPMLNSVGANSNGLLINRIYAAGGNLSYNNYFTPALTGTLTLTNCRVIGGTATTGAQQLFRALYGGIIVMTDNVFQNINNSAIATLTGVGSTYKNNTFYGCSGAAYSTDGIINPVELSGDKCDRCGYYLYHYTTAIGCINTGVLLGTETVNGYDVRFTASAFIQYELASPTGNVSVLTTDLTSTANGTHFRISDYNDTADDDRNWLTNGYIVRTKSTLSDTTVHTAGGSGMRFESISSTNRLEWEQSIPTGNIQNQSMTVLVWCKINNANYYSGTHQMPRLTIDYDNGTTAYAQAAQSTDWQTLFVTFTPTTTYGQIKATLSTMTDQTGSSAYVYFDDYGVLYPAGYTFDLGSMDLWANAMPVMPTIATLPGASTFWDELMSLHTTTGTYGALVSKLLKTSTFIALK